ncbi:D-arabinono-1,4-lactone oxidase [Hymenobacter radiodurans]|uniref:D-arabinono-1,4-lactone oxidase n=1 Tax=Hymenobacter radiodurans TaxID=2496028 RepID=UPI001058CB15|nr:D-arabinono-1,4-lactone oxidase [Hymenobacter radiodurans]
MESYSPLPLSSPAPVAPPLLNWAGNYRYSTTRLAQANSVEQVQEIVRTTDQLKVLGSRHCFNGIADSTQQLLSLEATEQAIYLDTDAHTVTVPASITYGRLAPTLHNQGFALHNLASLPHISVVGACATATHGSGIQHGNLATAVRAMEFVLASGEVRVLSPETDGDEFLGAVVHVGALGVVTKLTLAMEPTFQLRQDVYENLPLTQVCEHFAAIQASAYSVSLFTDWQDERITQVWLKQRLVPGAPLQPAPSEFFGAQRATQDLHPLAGLSPVNCTEQMGVPGPWHDRLPHFRLGFTPSSGQELQSEYFVPLRHAQEAIRAVARLHEHLRPSLQVSEMRTVAADALWLSPCYQQDSLAIHFTWKPDWAAVSRVLPLLERELSPFGVRPHWGKLFTLSATQLQSQYEKLPAFQALMAQYDPKGKFRNAFVNTYLAKPL